jgi:deoxyribodipyrimidine photolyase
MVLGHAGRCRPRSNPANWQWVAGSGADAAPYFRVFNPILQGEKFDPDRAYVSRWVPELAPLPASPIHQPWSASRLSSPVPASNSARHIRTQSWIIDGVASAHWKLMQRFEEVESTASL